MVKNFLVIIQPGLDKPKPLPYNTAMSNRDHEKDIEHLTLVVDILRNERDEARREICNATPHPEMEAHERGWDCFNKS